MSKQFLVIENVIFMGIYHDIHVFAAVAHVCKAVTIQEWRFTFERKIYPWFGNKEIFNVPYF